jgi:secretion/DNA translocation related TadE-like protein
MSHLHRDDERGSAAVLATVLIGLLVVVSMFVGALGAVVADQRRVESAADLAALAAAAALQSGVDACAAAGSVARRNGARLRSCRVSGDLVAVEVMRGARVVLGRAVRVSAQARAGPVGLR